MTRRKFLKNLAASGFVSGWTPELWSAMPVRPAEQTILLGGTAFALGMALARPTETLVVERGVVLAPEFTLTAGFSRLGAATSEIGRELCAQARRCGLLQGDRIELPPFSDFLASFFSLRGGRCLLETELISVERQNGSWQVGFFPLAIGGLVMTEAADFLDTTDLAWRNLGLDAVSSRHLGAMAREGDIAVELPAATTWREGRLRLFEEAERKMGRTIISEYAAFKTRYVDSKVGRRMSAGYWWNPSAQYGTFMEAFEAGYAWTMM